MARRDHGQRKRRGVGKPFPSGRAARLSFEEDLRGFGFEEAEIEAAWYRRDGVERVAIELMALAAGLASIEDLASDVVRRARNTFGWAGVAQIPSEKIEAIARRAWEEWETLTGRLLEDRPPSVPGAGVFALLLETEQKLGWAVYPPGPSGMAARIIVRMELFSVIGQAYPLLKEECRRQFRDEWNRCCGMVRPRGSDVVVDARFLGGVVD
ncbi:MAG: hypothetical protein ACLPOA_08000 [Methylocella sp.]|jgi:hypothetical protein